MCEFIMCQKVDCVLLLLILVNCQYVITGTQNITYYTYGNRTDGERISYFYHGNVPIFTPHYCMMIEPMNNTKESFEPSFTYVKVAYYNRVSNLNIEFKPETSMLCFDIKFPFIETPIGIWGYSLHNESI